MDLTNNNAKHVQSISGHSSAQMIFDKYQHTKDAKRVVANKMADKLGQGFAYQKDESNTQQAVNESLLTQLIELIKSDPLLQQKIANALVGT